MCDSTKNEKKPVRNLAVIAIIGMMAATAFGGCIGEKEEGTGKVMEVADKQVILPQWSDGDYHNYSRTTSFLMELNETYPDLVDLFSIGKSVQGKDLWCIRITNEKNNQRKFSCLIDGCIHGNEWESAEFCLYLAEYLLINYNTNATTRGFVNGIEIYIIPIVNPDGREADTRQNANGVNLNRNFDVDWGNPFGTSFQDPLRLGIPLENCGPSPFSEPESCALRDFMEYLHNKNFAFYMPCHTANHAILGPWCVADPPFTLPERDLTLIEHVFQWVRDNTEYEAGRAQWGNTTGGQPMAASGTAQDWCYMRHRVPSFTMEIYQRNETGHSRLVYWMKATLPVALYFLTNVENLYNWELPVIQPVLPEGIPPGGD